MSERPIQCPLCGGPADTRCSRDGEAVWVQCKAEDCKTHGPTRYNEAEVIAAWNRRVTPKLPEREEIARVLAPFAIRRLHDLDCASMFHWPEGHDTESECDCKLPKAFDRARSLFYQLARGEEVGDG